MTILITEHKLNGWVCMCEQEGGRVRELWCVCECLCGGEGEGKEGEDCYKTLHRYFRLI